MICFITDFKHVVFRDNENYDIKRFTIHNSCRNYYLCIYIISNIYTLSNICEDFCTAKINNRRNIRID